jgi:putative membrane protein
VSEALQPTDAGPRRLHPASLVTRYLRILPQMAFGGVGLVAAAPKNGYGNLLLFAAIAAVIGFAMTLLFWWRFRYTIGAGEIVIEKGLFQRQRRVIPFDRVQDISIEQRPLARLFGTAKVKIETGGSAKDEGSLDMIGLAEANALRDAVRGVTAAAAASGQAAPVPAEEPVLFALGLPRLLYSGLFGFSLLFLAAITGAVQYLDQWGLITWRDWFTRARADEAAHLVTLQLGLLLALLVVLAGLVAGVARTVARDFGYRLTRAPQGLRRKRGLFTLSEVVIPIRRTQVALIESGPVARLLGWYRLSFQTLGADQKEGGMQVAAPFARMAEILPILAEAGFPAPPPRREFHGVPRRALVRRVGPWLLLAALVAIGAWLFEPRAGFAAAGLALAALAALLRWRKHSHALDGRALFVSRGLLTRRVWVVPFEKAQTISVSHDLLQRPLRLGSLLVDTAGASAMRSQLVRDLDAAEAERLAGLLYRLFLEARARIRQVPPLSSSRPSMALGPAK